MISLFWKKLLQTNKNVLIISMYNCMMNPMKISVVIKSHASTTVTDKVRNRLEQLDDFEEGLVQEMLNLSQQDYVKRIEELNQQLITAWENDQRVKALKIVIQVRLHGSEI